MGKILICVLIFLFTESGFMQAAENKGTGENAKSRMQYYVSLNGILAECNIDSDKMEIKLMKDKDSKSYSLQSVSAGPVSKFENAEATVRMSYTGISIITKELEDVIFFPADKYSGMIKSEPGSVPMEYYITDAVTNVFVIMTPIGAVSGKWYLLKGDPPDFDSTYNTTLYELLGEDGKTTFQCFMQDLSDNNKFILLSPDCNIKNQTEFYLLKEN
ncbi:MAG: hypothetical protein ABI528_03580 [bacterium]